MTVTKQLLNVVLELEDIQKVVGTGCYFGTLRRYTLLTTGMSVAGHDILQVGAPRGFLHST